jgi:hypothetical protein
VLSALYSIARRERESYTNQLYSSSTTSEIQTQRQLLTILEPQGPTEILQPPIMSPISIAGAADPVALVAIDIEAPAGIAIVGLAIAVLIPP